jgi:hypothetical protein
MIPIYAMPHGGGEACLVMPDSIVTARECCASCRQVATTQHGAIFLQSEAGNRRP